VFFYFFIIIQNSWLLHFGLPDYFFVCLTGNGLSLNVCFVIALQNPVEIAVRLKTVSFHDFTKEFAAKFIVGLFFKL
jgi:hypothetical protein